MHILICIDNNYTMQCGVLIASILYTNDMEILFHIFSEDISEENKAVLRKSLAGSKNNIEFYKIESSIIKYLPVKENDYLSIAAYFRIFIGQLLPANIDKVLYLDSDMVVVDSLQPLWDTDLMSFSTAAVIDTGGHDIRHFNRLDYPVEYGYFNSGMMLINLDFWRKNDISNRAIKFILEKPELCKQHDQDVLNYLLFGTVKYISSRFNYIDIFFSNISLLLIDKKYHEDILRSADNICIIHFAGGEKPWHKECRHPYRTIWDLFCNKTHWNNYAKKNRYHGKKWIKRKIKSLCLWLGILDSNVTNMDSIIRNKYKIINRINSLKINEKSNI